mmetsp:Transcript_13260/g.26512  ORF Transcript_13260/g.26512 Transcript_13260/m.26512 type:complete len:406 (-) Transcript_13260:1874-3091(-)
MTLSALSSIHCLSIVLLGVCRGQAPEAIPRDQHSGRDASGINTRIGMPLHAGKRSSVLLLPIQPLQRRGTNHDAVRAVHFRSSCCGAGIGLAPPPLRAAEGGRLRLWAKGEGKPGDGGGRERLLLLLPPLLPLPLPALVRVGILLLLIVIITLRRRAEQRLQPDVGRRRQQPVGGFRWNLPLGCALEDGLRVFEVVEGCCTVAHVLREVLRGDAGLHALLRLLLLLLHRHVQLAHLEVLLGVVVRLALCQHLHDLEAMVRLLVLLALVQLFAVLVHQLALLPPLRVEDVAVRDIKVLLRVVVPRVVVLLHHLLALSILFLSKELFPLHVLKPLGWRRLCPREVPALIVGPVAAMIDRVHSLNPRPPQRLRLVHVVPHLAVPVVRQPQGARQVLGHLHLPRLPAQL